MIGLFARKNPSAVTVLIAFLSFFIGGWMVFDGSRKLLTRLYTGEDTVGLGPWAGIVSLVGIRPSDMAFPFVLLGGLWIVNAVILLLGAAGRYERTILASVLTLWYLVPGALISLATLILSLRERKRGPVQK